MAPLENDPLYTTDEELEAYHARLVAQGRMRLSKGSVPPEFFDEPLAPISTESLVPFISGDRDEDDEDDEDDAYLEKLIAEGRARPPIDYGPLPPEFWEEQPINISEKELIALVSEDRDEDRIWPN